jgi:hypothetical protein
MKNPKGKTGKGNASPEERYGIAGSHVVYDRFDDEVVAINLLSGCYFSLRDTALEIWNMITGGASRDELYAAIRTAYSGSAEDMKKSLSEFLDQLTAEDLIRGQPSEGPASLQTALVDGTNSNERRPFSIPKLVKYDDQKELLLLDPIHEVGELGWPEKK